MADGYQLALPFPRQPGLTATDLVPHGGIGTALEFLAATGRWPARRLALWGPHATGKTHLLHVWADEQGASLLGGSHLREPCWPEGPVAIDDADQVPSERALLHLLNAAGEARRPLLLASTRPPGRWPVRLPDLASRLRATTAIELAHGGDAFLATLLARLLADRQLAVKPEVQSYLLARLPRTPAVIREAVDRLDETALRVRAEISKPFAGQVLTDWLGPVSEGELP